jgi:hypothetical protein
MNKEQLNMAIKILFGLFLGLLTVNTCKMANTNRYVYCGYRDFGIAGYPNIYEHIIVIFDTKKGDVIDLPTYDDSDRDKLIYKFRGTLYTKDEFKRKEKLKEKKNFRDYESLYEVHP